MLSKLRRNLTYANLMGTFAAFVALGGTSYAVATGLIDSREIKDNSVRSTDLRNDDVRSKDVRDRSLLAEDFMAGQLPAGQQGETGAPGPTGAEGPPGISGLQTIDAESASNSNTGKDALAVCPAGKRVIGTGADVLGGATGNFPNFQTDVAIRQVIPVAGTSVLVTAAEDKAHAGNWSVMAYAICANVS
jgi:hypothetical protein